MKSGDVRCQDGFTLLETLVAFTVLSIVIISSMEVFGDSTKRVVRAQQQAADLMKLQNAMASLRLQVDLSEIRKTVDLDVREIEMGRFGEAELRPFLLTVSLKDGQESMSLQTIILKAH